MGDLDWERWISGTFWIAQGRWLVTAVVTAGVKLLGIFLLYLLARRLLIRAVDRLLPPLLTRVHPTAPVSESRARTIGGLLKSIGQYVLLFITAVMALQVLGLEVA